jgi:ferredoxin
MRIRVDHERCEGHSRCFALAPELFDVDEYGTSTARDGGMVPPELLELAHLALRNCPELAIEIVAD